MGKSISPPERWPSGEKKRPRRLAQIAEAQKAAEEANMVTVLSQPHRRGNRSQLAENPMGRFCLIYGLDRALYDAAEAYAQLRSKYQAACNCPMIDRLGGSGEDLATKTKLLWLELLREWEKVMFNSGGYLGRLGVISLAVDKQEQAVKIYHEDVIASLKALAIHQGRMAIHHHGRIKPLALPKSNRAERS